MSGRIPQHFIDDLLARVNIVDVVDSRLKLKRAGKNYSALCPFHKEKSPSFSVSSDKQFYYCFGCGAGGNALGFVMEFERLSFPEAVEELSKSVGLDVPREHDRTQDIEREKQVKQQFDTLEQSNLYYQQQLRLHAGREKAVSYLKNRGLSGQIAARYQLGYAPPGWDNLSTALADQRPDLAELLLKSGMLVENEEKQSRYDRFRDRIMFPIRDTRGRVVGFGGRVLNDDKPKYLNSPETDTFHKGRELYGLFEARQQHGSLDRLLIVEGYMDVVSLAQHGLTWSVATLGTATTEFHLERIFKLVTEVIFCFDGDRAGRQAARRALDTAVPVMRDGLMARFLFLPEGEDPDTLIRQEGLEAFQQRVAESLPFSEFFFKSLSDGLDLTSMDGRAQMSTLALPLIQGMLPSLLQQMMLDRISEITGLALDQLNAVVNLQKAVEAGASSQPNSARYNIPTDRPDHAGGGYFQARKPAPLLVERSGTRISLVNSAISILLHRPDLAAEAVSADELKGIEIQNIELLQKLLRYLQSSSDLSLGTLLLDWQRDPELAPEMMLLNEISHLDPVLENVDAARLLDDALNRILLRKTEAELNELKRLSRERQLQDGEKQRLQLLLTRQITKN